MIKRYYARQALGKVLTCYICLQPVNLCLWYVEGKTIYGPEARMCEMCYPVYGTGHGKKFDSTTHKVMEVLDG